jgi:hypothetical protein
MVGEMPVGKLKDKIFYSSIVGGQNCSLYKMINVCI